MGRSISYHFETYDMKSMKKKDIDADIRKWGHAGWKIESVNLHQEEYNLIIIFSIWLENK